RRRHQVNPQHVIPLLQQVPDNGTPGFATTASHHDFPYHFQTSVSFSFAGNHYTACPWAGKRRVKVLPWSSWLSTSSAPANSPVTRVGALIPRTNPATHCPAWAAESIEARMRATTTRWLFLSILAASTSAPYSATCCSKVSNAWRTAAKGALIS